MADEKMDVCSPDRKRSRHEADYREGEGDREGAAMSDEKMVEVADGEGEGDGEGGAMADVSACSPVDRADEPEGEVNGDSQDEADDRQGQGYFQDYEEGYFQDYEELTLFNRLNAVFVDSNMVEEERTCRPDFVCKIPHKIPRLFGETARQVFSITIHRMFKKYPESAFIKIHGAIILRSRRRQPIELFARPESEPVVFNSANRKLTLPLQGPNMPWAFNADEGQVFICLLKYNGVDMFEVPSTDNLQKDCSVFPTGHPIVGCGIIEFPLYIAPCTGFMRKTFDRISPTMKGVFVEAQMRTMMRGMVGVLKFTALRDLSLSGKITARSCLSLEGIVVLFEEEKQKEKQVLSTDFIPLSRNMIAVDIRSSLLIKIKLFDGNTKKFLHETVHFNADEKGTEKTTPSKAINVKVDWVLPQ